jgi:hypothetical protein
MLQEILKSKESQLFAERDGTRVLDHLGQIQLGSAENNLSRMVYELTELKCRLARVQSTSCSEI